MSFDISNYKENEELLPILKCILGEGTGSNLQERIREELCYTCAIAAYIEWYKDFAALYISFSVPRKVLKKCHVRGYPGGKRHEKDHYQTGS